MRIVLPHSRASFTKADFEFITGIISGDSGNPNALESLFECPDTLDQILDEKDLFHALLETPDSLFISLELYFYIIVRNILLQKDIVDREIADYIAAVLSNFSHKCLSKNKSDRNSALPYVIDLLMDIENAEDPHRFELTTSTAETLMIMCGIFPEHIEYRKERKAAPGISYYEAFGRSQYEAAGHHDLARQLKVDHIYTEISQSFPHIRTALNDMRERLMVMESPSINFPNDLTGIN